MVRFSCFSTHMHGNKSKKAIRLSTESMHKTFQDCTMDQELKVSNTLNPLVLDTQDDNPSNAWSEQVISPSSIDHCWKPEEMHESSSTESNREMRLRGRINKSMSLGTGLDREGKLSCGIDSEEETEQAISGAESHESNCNRSYDASDHNRSEERSDSQDAGMHVNNQYHKALVQGETTSTIGDPEQLEEGTGYSATDLSGGRASDSEHHGPSTPRSPPTITKSYSLPNMGDSPKSREVSTSQVHVEPQGGSSQNSDGLDPDRKEFLSHGVRTKAIADQERDSTKLEKETDRCKNSSIDKYDNSNFDGVAKNWSSPGKDGVHVRKDYQRQSSVRWDELPTKEYKIKRIEEWVRMIDLEDRDHLQEIGEDRTHVQEIGESSHSVEKVRKPSDVFGGLTSAKLEGKHSVEAMHSMEAAKNYISSLSAASTSAQLVNLGLVVIPFLSAFVSLKVLNLSGNAIVRITAGALPRGLHALNLSKNNISTIEGLRELTRLRVLDLSYNRIFRIGHGLASCSSLKELYLAGNKISEVEGLHRLLKLNVLDLRFNKISTAKCLGQLAANYSSLQAIRLEGNPAQTNVGDEHLKKYLQSLVPHLVYYNKQPIRASSSKEVVDRPIRSAIPTAQFDRGLRSEHSKLARKGIHSTASTNKVPPSLMHGRPGQAVSSSKQSKGRHGRVPLSGTKGTRHHHQHHYTDLGEKLLNWQANFSVRRSQSEGNLLNPEMTSTT